MPFELLLAFCCAGDFKLRLRAALVKNRDRENAWMLHLGAWPPFLHPRLQTISKLHSVLTHATGQIFSYPVRHTWEFTSDNPIRSVFPLWPVYGLPMLLLQWLWIGRGQPGEMPPIAVFWTLRVLMFVISFVLEDWAIHELIHSPRHRRVAVLLVASSYVTWTYQTHTFSNSIETLIVAWSMVLVQRIVEAPVSWVWSWYRARPRDRASDALVLTSDSNVLPFSQAPS